MCVWGTTKGAGRGEQAKDDKPKEMAKSGQRAGLGLGLTSSAHPHLALAWLANVKFVESWPNTFDGKDGRAQLAGDAGTSLVYPHSPLPAPLLHMPTVCCLRLCMYVYVGRSLASFLYAIEHTLMLYDVVMLVKMLVHTHAPLYMCVCVCELPHATSHCLQEEAVQMGEGGGHTYVREPHAMSYYRCGHTARD